MNVPYILGQSGMWKGGELTVYFLQTIAGGQHEIYIYIRSTRYVLIMPVSGSVGVALNGA